MKKKNLSILIAILSLFIFIFTLTACDDVKFKVNFVVDGEVYATIDTSGKEIIQIPENPIKENYSFDGWFWDNGTWQKPFTANSLLDAPLSSDMNVYCKWKEIDTFDTIIFNTLNVNEENVYGKVSNDTSTFSFIDEITENGKATYKVYKEITCETEIISKTISLNVGDNTVYILQTVGNDIKLYTVTVRRKPIHTVVFESNGGTEVQSQMVEEDSLATKPDDPTKEGYAFNVWDYDFSKPIESNTTIHATWIANSNTKYKVEYYLQNLQNNDYSLEAVADKEGTTDTVVYAEIRTFNHFTPTLQTVSGNVESNGSTVLKVYYNRNKYSLEATNGTVTNSGNHKYGKEITTIATPHLGYEFVGWYCGDDVLSEDITFKFKVEKNIIAKFAIKEEMSNFNFDATTSTCIINGIKDKTLTEIIVPEYVTSISGGAFSGCSSLKNITIPFIGDVAGKTGDYSRLPFGYIFGTKNYAGAEEIEQWYSDPGSSTTEKTYYIPASLKTVVVTGGDVFFGAFSNCRSLTSIIMGDGVTRIGIRPFYECSSLSSIKISKNVTVIDFAAFSKDNWMSSKCVLNAIYYGGTEVEWEKISFNNGNGLLEIVTRYYYVENESDLPADNGNYWHYVNGVPTVWSKPEK